MAKKPIKKVAKKAPPKKAVKKTAKPAKKVAKKATKKMPISAKTGKIVTAKYAKAHPKTTVNLTVKKKAAKKVVKKTAKKVQKKLPAPKKQLALPKSSTPSKATPLKPVVKGRIPEQSKTTKVAAATVTNTKPVFDKAGFDALTKSQKREFLVTNCIKLMEQGLGVGKGDYIKSPSLEKSLKRIGQRTDLKTMLENASDVKVCGAGILLYADILLRGEYDVYQGADLGAIGLDDIVRRLPYFEEQQLKEIESAFETKWAFSSDDKHNIPAVIFGQKFTDDRRRMAAILQNILTNQGNFRP